MTLDVKKYEYTLYRTKSIVECWGLARSSYLGCGGVIAIASWWFVNLGRSGGAAAGVPDT